jgi:leucyl aminopeptidase (aminopeptidase T)
MRAFLSASVKLLAVHFPAMEPAAKQMTVEQIASLLQGMLEPRRGERLLFLTDYGSKPSLARHKRAELLSRWHHAALALSEKTGMRVLPVVKYPDTLKQNADLPSSAATQDGGRVDDLPALIASADIVIAMTEHSASAPLKNIAKKSAHLRVVSMPGVLPDMEPAMAADYSRIANRGKRLLAVVEPAVGFEITFDGAGIPRGTRFYADTRASSWALDSGQCLMPGDFINFPSGELFTPLYEAATPEGRSIFGESQTHGILPAYSYSDGKVAFLHIEKNRIVRVQGDCAEAARIIEDIAKDERNANIAELGLGLNDSARAAPGVMVLEAEKAGVHLAYGRSDHFGSPGSHAGKVAASIHRDLVFARGAPINATVHAVYQNGRRLLIAERGKVVAV